MSRAPLGVRIAAQRVSRVVGRASADLHAEPAFLIVGAQRCGTTSLYRALTQHPAIFAAGLHKGAHYFDTGYHHGPRWYRGQFPLQRTLDRAGRTTGIGAITGESSPYYMFHPLAPERIAHDLPGVRVIVLLRDPVERAYSAHTHESARGFETESFERALELEESRLAGERERLIAEPESTSFAHQHHGYLARGRYTEQLQRLESLFGRDRLCVVDSEDFFRDPDPIFGEVLDFLAIAPRGHIHLEQRNARPRAPMPRSLRARLTESFESEADQLARWWGRVPSWRR